MIIKSFISSSVHDYYFNLISELLRHTPDETKMEMLLKELVIQKDELDQIYTEYKTKFEELHVLIKVYHLQQTQIRKKIREIQLANKEKNHKN